MPGPSDDFNFPDALAPFGPVPLVLTPLTTDEVFLLAVYFSNPTAGPINVTVADAAGQKIIPTTEVPPGLTLDRDFPMVPFIGVQWLASAAGLVGVISKYSND